MKFSRCIVIFVLTAPVLSTAAAAESSPPAPTKAFAPAAQFAATTAACLASPLGKFSSPAALVEHLMDEAQIPRYDVDPQRDGMSTITTLGPRGDEIDRQVAPADEVATILTSKAVRARAIREFLVKSVLDAGVDPACGSACPELELRVDPACGSACPEDQLLGLDLQHPACQLLLDAASAATAVTGARKSM